MRLSSHSAKEEWAVQTWQVERVNEKETSKEWMRRKQLKSAFEDRAEEIVKEYHGDLMRFQGLL
jgi:hypothetical protein